MLTEKLRTARPNASNTKRESRKGSFHKGYADTVRCTSGSVQRKMARAGKPVHTTQQPERQLYDLSPCFSTPSF